LPKEEEEEEGEGEEGEGEETVPKRKKRQYENNKVKEIEHLMNQNQTRKFYREINRIQMDN
jgi:hypothetical protein